jgi:hypothetical protein
MKEREMSHMEERKHLFEKIKEHKTEIIATGVTLISLAGVILIAKNWNSIKGFTGAGFLRKGPKACVSIAPASTLIESNVTSNLSCNKIVDVSDHIRNLSAGRHASAEKLAAAAEHGYNLLPNQTWVIPYTKKCA